MDGFAIVDSGGETAVICAKAEFLPNVELDCSLQVSKNQDNLDFYTPEVVEILRTATLLIREAVEDKRIKPREPIGRIKKCP